MYYQDDIIDPNIITQLREQLGNLLYTHNLVIDSRSVNEQSIFFAYPGTANDGRNYIQSAIDSGAQFILWEDDGYVFNFACQNYGIKNLMHYVGILAAFKENQPSHEYKVLGVTGTNGKTSITHWLNQSYMYLKQKSGIIGTIGAGVYPQIQDFAKTTPDPIYLQHLLSKFAHEKCKMVAMEVSSIALDQGRVNGVNFTTAIFTNLSIDHLDYHHTLENYYQAKRKLFLWQGLQHALINTDDSYGLRLFNEISQSNNKELNLLSYGINSGELRAVDVKIDIFGVSFTLKYKDESINVAAKIVGRFNVYNLLAVAGSLIVDGYSLVDVAQVLSILAPVCGRMDTIILEGKPLVVIDYAHTPDALDNTLQTLSALEGRGKLYCVVGCGGNRDKTKRPLMGDIATRIADFVVFTSDNPRFEDPDLILQEITCGISLDNFIVVENRRLAIQAVLKLASGGDIVLIAGKGHELYQEIQGVKVPFSDFEVTQEFLG